MSTNRSLRALLLLPGMIAAALFLAASGPTIRESPTEPQAEIDRLRKLVRKGGGDSLRYELALALRDAGTIENRRFALDLFEELRPSHENDPRYYWDRSLNFELSGRFMDARRDLEEVIRLDSLDVAAQVHLSRLWLREVLRVYDLPLLPRMETHLFEALRLEPDHPEALFLMSLTLHLQKFLPEADPPELTFRGRTYAARLLDADSTAHVAHLLLAVHSLGISRFAEAEREFLTYIDSAPREVRSIFLTSDRTSRASIAERVRKLEPAHRADYDATWWWYRDPSPLTAINEAQLEYWKRLAEAEFLFGDPARGLRGWDTEPGEAWIRLGAPQVRAFDPGAVDSDPRAGGADAYKSTIRLTPPSWSWGYRIGGTSFSLRFEDRSLRGEYFADKQTAVLMHSLRESVPAVFQDAAPGRISTLFVSGTGTAGEGGRVRETLHLAIGPWRKPDGKKWLKDARFLLTVRDSTYRKIVDTEHHILPRHVYEPTPGATILVLTRDLNLVPGRYLVTASVEDRDEDLSGSVALTLDIPDFDRGDSLRVSDLDLVLTADRGDRGPTRTRLGRTFVPNPMGMVADARNLDVFYEIYNLVSRLGRSTYSLRYTVLPRLYVVGYDYHVRSGTARPNTLVTLAESGIAIQGTELTAGNYSDVRFPPEAADLKPDQTHVKGARVDVGGLDPGEYVLVVTVTDESTGAEASSMRLFRIVTDETFRELFTWKP